MAKDKYTCGVEQSLGNSFRGQIGVTKAKQGGEYPNERSHLANFAGSNFNDGVGDEPEAQAGGDAECERRRENCDEGGNRFAEVGPINFSDRLSHERADKD